MAAEFEEVVVDADTLESEDLRPDVRQQPLRVCGRRLVPAVQAGLVCVGGRESGSVDFSVGVSGRLVRWTVAVGMR
jgi:hypothetical protein